MSNIPKLNSQHTLKKMNTIIKVDNTTGKLITELYTKDTDTHDYLHFTSSNPRHCKTGGPHEEFLRIRRNCSKLEDYDKHSNMGVEDYIR